MRCKTMANISLLFYLNNLHYFFLEVTPLEAHGNKSEIFF